MHETLNISAKQPDIFPQNSPILSRKTARYFPAKQPDICASYALQCTLCIESGGYN